jgi:beta-lactam-binding protein with PASTA domain
VAAASKTATSAGLVISVSGAGTVTSQKPTAGTLVEPGTSVLVTAEDGGPKIPKEYQVKLSTISSIEDPAKRNALRLLITQIANAVDTTASHMRLSVEITVAPETMDTLKDAADNAGAAISTTEI